MRENPMCRTGRSFAMSRLCEGRVAIVTGAGRGVGREHALLLAAHGAKVMVDDAIARFGRLDVLVNNAGILRDRMLTNMEESEWDDVIRVHLKGTFAPSRHAAAYWRDESKRIGGPVKGRIINTSSTSGIY